MRSKFNIKNKSNFYPKKLWLLLIFIGFSAIIINSYKKDNYVSQQSQSIAPEIAQAKSWYESNFPLGTGKISTPAIGINVDYSQFVAPTGSIFQHTIVSAMM